MPICHHGVAMPVPVAFVHGLGFEHHVNGIAGSIPRSIEPRLAQSLHPVTGQPDILFRDALAFLNG